MPSVLASLTVVLGLALWSAPHEPPAPEQPRPNRLDEVAECLRTCDAQADATDRATCRLQCEETVHAKDEPNIERWRRSERITGGFDGQEKTHTHTTTVTTSTPRGSTRTSTTSGREGPETTPPDSAVPASPVVLRYRALAGCQSQCDVHRLDGPRATCKLQCLRDPHRAQRPQAPHGAAAVAPAPAPAPARGPHAP